MQLYFDTSMIILNSLEVNKNFLACFQILHLFIQGSGWSKMFTISPPSFNDLDCLDQILHRGDDSLPPLSASPISKSPVLLGLETMLKFFSLHRNTILTFVLTVNNFKSTLR